jgi:hypothetical protein
MASSSCSMSHGRLTHSAGCFLRHMRRWSPAPRLHLNHTSQAIYETHTEIVAPSVLMAAINSRLSTGSTWHQASSAGAAAGCFPLHGHLMQASLYHRSTRCLGTVASSAASQQDAATSGEPSTSHVHPAAAQEAPAPAVVAASKAGRKRQRLDDYVLALQPGRSKNMVQSWILQGKVVVNDKVVKKAGAAVPAGTHMPGAAACKCMMYRINRNTSSSTGQPCQLTAECHRPRLKQCPTHHPPAHARCIHVP